MWSYKRKISRQSRRSIRAYPSRLRRPQRGPRHPHPRPHRRPHPFLGRSHDPRQGIQTDWRRRDSRRSSAESRCHATLCAGGAAARVGEYHRGREDGKFIRDGVGGYGVCGGSVSMDVGGCAFERVAGCFGGVEEDDDGWGAADDIGV